MSLPYINMLLKQFARGNPVLETSFGTHIHWGYWPDPAAADPSSPADYAVAAERLSLELIELAGIAPGMRVLDAGCGFGGTLALLNDRIPDLDLTGLNIDARQLARAVQMAAGRPGRPPAFVAADACRLPFADASFDRVMAVECIFHFPSRAAFLQEVWRVLRPGGALVLSDFVPAPVFAPAGRALKLPLLKRFNMLGECDTSCTAAQYRRLAEEAGLSLAVLRDVTRNTLPTYPFLSRLVGGGALGRLSRTLVFVMDFTGRRGLLRYSLLRFDKP